jgi:hypothetical protein
VKEAIKKYAITNGKSVSAIVENMLAALTGVTRIPRENPVDDIEISPFIENLNVQALGIELPIDFDPDKAIAEYLEEKYK